MVALYLFLKMQEIVRRQKSAKCAIPDYRVNMATMLSLRYLP